MVKQFLKSLLSLADNMSRYFFMRSVNYGSHKQTYCFHEDILCQFSGIDDNGSFLFNCYYFEFLLDNC